MQISLPLSLSYTLICFLSLLIAGISEPSINHIPVFQQATLMMQITIVVIKYFLAELQSGARLSDEIFSGMVYIFICGGRQCNIFFIFSFRHDHS